MIRSGDRQPELDAETVEELPARRIHPPTAEELEAIRKQAYDDAYQEGKDAGYRDGLAAGKSAGKTQTDQRLQQLQSTMDLLCEPIREREAALEEIILDLVTELSQAVIQTELQFSLVGLPAVIHEAVAALPTGSEHVRIALNPQDLEWLKEQGSLPDDWKLEANTAVQSGGCRVYSEHSVVDYELAGRFAHLVEQLRNRGLQKAGIDDQEPPRD